MPYQDEMADLLKERKDADKQVATAQTQAAQQLPADDAARASALGKMYGAPPDMVGRNLPAFETRFSKDVADRVLDRNPAISKYLSVPENAAVSHDDWPGMVFVNDLLRAFDRSALSVRQGAEVHFQGIDDQARADEHLSFAEIFADERKKSENKVKGFADGFDDIANPFGDGPDKTAPDIVRAPMRSMIAAGDDLISAYARYVSKTAVNAQDTEPDEQAKRRATNVVKLQKIMDARAANSPEVQDMNVTMQANIEELGGTLGLFKTIVDQPIVFMRFGAETLAEFVPIMIASGAISAVTRKPFGLVAGGGSLTFEATRSTSEFMQRHGVDFNDPESVLAKFKDPEFVQEVRTHANARGIVIGILDGLSGGVAGTMLSKSKTGNILLQGLAQSLMGAGGEAAAQFTTEGEITSVAEVWLEGLLEFGTLPIELPLAHGTRMLREGQRARRATKVFEALSGLQEASKVSKTKERAAANFAEMVDTAVVGGPVENLYVAADKIVELAQEQGVEPLSLVARLGNVNPDEFLVALQSGGDFTIPLGTYMSEIADTDAATFIQMHARVDPADMSMAQAEDYAATEGSAQFQEMVDAETIAIQEGSVLTAVEDQIQGLMAQRFEEAGSTPDIAAQHAAVYPAFFRAMAELTGQSTQELLDAYPLPLVEATAHRVEGATPPDKPRGVPPGTSPRPPSDTVGEGAEGSNVPVDGTVPGELLNQGTALRSGLEDLEAYGITAGGRHKTRDIARALERRTQDLHGTIDDKDTSEASMERIADWMTTEVMHEVQSNSAAAEGKSAVGWYTTKFQAAIDHAGAIYPELLTDPAARQMFTLLVAITSDGQRARKNFHHAMAAYGDYRDSGSLGTFESGGRGNIGIDTNFKIVQEIIDKFGIEGAMEYLLQERTVSELNKIAKEDGISFSAKYPAKRVMPLAALVLGPKVGAFFANLTGATGYLTMDRWWSRTFNRYRGSLLTEHNQQGLQRFKQLLTDDFHGNQYASDESVPYDKLPPNIRVETVEGGSDPFEIFSNEGGVILVSDPPAEITDAEALEWTVFYAKMYAAKGYKNGSAAEKAANTIFKAAFVNMKDSPARVADRGFMIDTVNRAQEKLSEKGVDLTVADIQATLWYYEKRLYGELGARMTEDISYEEVAAEIAADPDGYNPGTFRDIVEEPREEDELELTSDGGISTGGLILNQGGAPVDPGVMSWAYLTVDNLSNIMKLPGWAILTAENPAATHDTPQEANNEFMRELRQQLNNEGIPFVEVAGKYGGKEENSLMILAPESKAVAIGKEYGQESILTYRGLVYMDGSINPSTGGMGVWEGDKSAEVDNVSVIEDNEGYFMTFSVGIDFGIKIPPFGEAVDDSFIPATGGDDVSELMTAGNKKFKEDIDADELAINSSGGSLKHGPLLTAAVGPAPGQRNTPAGNLVGWTRNRQTNPPSTRDDGTLVLQHFSPIANLEQTGVLPSKFGTRTTPLRTPEITRSGSKRFVPRSFYGIATGERGGYKVENHLGDNAYETVIDAGRLYNADEDVGGLWAKSDDTNIKEENILVAGYAGYWSQHKQLGAVAVVFEALNVIRVSRPSESATRGGFSEYIKDTSVKTPNGKPRLMFHATAGDFDTFVNTRDIGFHFGSVDQANDIAMKRNKAGRAGVNLMPVFLNIKNPLRTDDLGTWEPHSIFWAAVKQGVFDERENLIFMPYFEAATAGGAAVREDAYERLRTMLEEKGIDGIVYKNTIEGNTKQPQDAYIAFRDHQIKGAFNKSEHTTSPNIMEQQNHGSIMLPVKPGDTPVIKLFENANLSTVIHESSHYFLYVLEQLAGAEKPAPEVAKMWNTVMGWARRNRASMVKELARAGMGGVVTEERLDEIILMSPTDFAKLSEEERKAVSVGVQEIFARTFEKYAMSGEAPSVALRSVFERFRSWLLSIYHHATSLDTAKLTPEIRSVMDRMLATKDELQNARETAEEDMLFKSALEMGVSEAEYAEFKSTFQKARDAATGDAMAAAMGPIRRSRSEWFKKEFEALRPLIEAELNSRKENRAYEWMANRRWLGDETPEDLPEMRLNKADLITLGWTEARLAKMPTGRKGRRLYGTEAATLSPQEVAEWFGFNNVDDLLYGLLTLSDPSTETDEMTKERINAQFEDPLSDGSIRDAATAAVHNTHKGSVLAREFAAIHRKVGDGAPAATAASIAAKVARAAIARLRVREASNPDRFVAAERKARREADKEFRSGNFAAAAEAKQRELLNYNYYLEAKRAARDLAQLERRAKRLGRKAGRKKLAGEYLPAVDAILELYDFRKMSGPAADRKKALLDYVNSMIDQGRQNELAIPRSVLETLEATPYKSLTVENMRGVLDSLKNIEHMARHKQKLLDAQRERDMDAVVKDIADGFSSSKLKKNPPARTDNPKERRSRSIRSAANILLSVDTILRKLDSYKDIGKVYQHIKRGIDEGMTKLTTMRREAGEALEQLYSPYTKAEMHEMAVPTFAVGRHGNFSKWDMISIALNMGNEENRQRLTDEKSPGSFTVQERDMMLNQLDKRDWDFVQASLDYINSFWDQIAARERRTTGVAPKKVIAVPIVTKYGIYPGGYYPIKYDPRLNSRTNEMEIADHINAMKAGGFGKAQTKNGHINERVGSGGQVLRVGIDVMHSHINEVIQDLAISEAVSNTWRILQDDRVKGLFREYGLDADLETLEMWVQDVAGGETSTGGPVQRLARKFKSNFTLAKLALNLSTAIIQPTGLFQSVVVVGRKWMLKGMADVAKRGFTGPDNAYSAVVKMSEFMRERSTTFNKDLYDMLGNITTGPNEGRYKRFQREFIAPYSFYLMTATQFYIVDVPTWYGSYAKGLDAGMSEKDAIFGADRAVARAQASGVFSDRTAIERGTLDRGTRHNDVVRLFTTLGSYMFSKANLAAEEVGKTDFRSPKSVMTMLMNLSLLFVWETVAYQLLKGNWPDEDDDEAWYTFVAKETAYTAMGTVPFVRDFAGGFEGFDTGGPYGAIGETLTKPFYQLAQGDLDTALVRSFVDLGGLAFGLPSTFLWRIGEAGYRQAKGEDVGPLEYAFGRKNK